MKDEDFVYVFSHIPKTAGLSFKSDIELENSPDHVMNAYYTYGHEFFNQHVGKREFHRGKEYFNNYVNALSPIKKEKIKYILGHDADHGIHQLINKPARYITFIREPVSRTISIYNYEKMNWGKLEKTDILNPNQATYRKRLAECFLMNGAVPDFETWLQHGYGKHHIFYYTMTDYLQYLGFIDDKRDEGSIQDALKKFYFVGLTETYDTDSAYLYHLLNVKYCHGHRNMSEKMIDSSKLSEETLEVIREKNRDDIVLHECAQRENTAFKKHAKDFYVKVNQTHFNMKLYYPFKRLQIMLKNMIRPWAKPIKEKIFK